jgi:hypothetical protein
MPTRAERLKRFFRSLTAGFDHCQNLLDFSGSPACWRTTWCDATLQNDEIRMENGGSRQAINNDYDDFELALLTELRSLWEEVDDLWERSQNSAGFHAYVSADYEAVFRSLVQLRGQALRFLEWGSGLGVVTIMASRLGFEAYGIESESELVDHAHAFGKRYGPAAHFICGNFFPSEFAGPPGAGGIESRTTPPGPAAYERLGRKLSDFDLVYAYPWPEERQLYQSVMRRSGGANYLFLTYDVRRGVELHHRDRPATG